MNTEQELAHWRERAAFEEWFTKTKAYISDPKHVLAQVVKDLAWEAWQAARTAKRGAVKVNVVFETQVGEVIGKTEAEVKRVEWQDDGSLIVVIDYWPQPTEPVCKTDWNAELASWSDEDFIRVFHERPDLANRLRKILAEPVKRKRLYAPGSALGEFGVIPMCDQYQEEMIGPELMDQLAKREL